jgi:branched-chain amino acid transport system ATP-binding protein
VGALLQLDRIVTHYGPIEVLKGIDLSIEDGEVVALLGGNAAGKSTTMKTILGLVIPSSGTVTFAEQDITRREPAYRISLGMATVPEARRLFSSMSVYDNLLMGAYVRRRLSWSEIRKDLDTVLGLFPHLAERLRQVAGTLSGGEQQMVAVGRALMARPRLILMDRALNGSRARPRRDDLRDRPQHQVARDEHAHRRTERHDGVGRGRTRLCPTDRRNRPAWIRTRIAEERQHTQGLSRRLDGLNPRWRRQ